MKIVFIINSISAQRCIKRIEEFIVNKYNIEAYGFNRNMGIFNTPEHFRIEVIGNFSNSTPLMKRIPIIRKGILKVIQKYKNEQDVVYYLFQLDIAMIFKSLAWNKKYFFEESDLMHTYIRNPIVKNILEAIDKRIIKNSLLSIFTSEGFLNYHYRDKRPENVYVIPNKLNVSIEQICKRKEIKCESGKLRIGFVGFPRYKSIVAFAESFCKNFPNYEFHIYGEPVEQFVNNFKCLRQYPNCIFHGSFLNPIDLPQIYFNIDLVLSTYDIEHENVRYAEPNKIYEAIYFETPIIVSSGTFLESKVKQLNIGYSVDPQNSSEVISLIKGINSNSIKEKIASCKKIDKEECLNINNDFFEKVRGVLAI